MITYEQAKRIVSSARNPEKGKPIGNNTRLIDYGDCVVVKYHATYIITIYPDGRYLLDNGGWYTVTTKARMNRYAPVRIYSHKGEWIVAGNPQTGRDNTKYENGMVVKAD
jgi:hypothetical protein